MIASCAPAKFGDKTTVFVAAGSTDDADNVGVVSLTVTSESDKTAVGTAKCKIPKDTSSCMAKQS